jgi:cysteine synthase
MPRSAFDIAEKVEDTAVRGRAVARLREKGARLPTFAELADPRRIPPQIAAALAGIDADDPDPKNLHRVHWFNDTARSGRLATPAYVELPEALTGVSARIVVALGALFPLIRAHKVLAAYACLVPRLVSGRFDPTRQRAVWPSTGNYCRGGVAISRILGCRAVAVLPEEMSEERFAWLGQWVEAEEDIVRTPGSEANVKEIYDRCAELARDSANEVVNQFCEFANYLAHWRCTGPALESIFLALAASGGRARLAAFVAASGSAGTLAAGDYLKEAQGARIAVVEALECPTLLNNGYGSHNIQGIGDKHVPLIHNVMNSDVVIGVSDRATDALNAVFNCDTGRTYLARRLKVAPAVLDSLAYFGLSSIANLLGAVALAKHYALSSDDVVLTVATDGHEMYASELARYLRRHNAKGELTEVRAAELTGRYLQGAGGQHVLEASERERERIFNLGYFTWVEQQGVALEHFEKRRSQQFWRGLRDVPARWDEMIAAFNRDTGMSAAS